MISHNSVLLTSTMALNIYHIGQRKPATIWTAQTDPFSHHTSPKTPHCICMTKICAACCHCHSKRKSSHGTMYPAIDSHHRKKCSHPWKTIQTTCASVHMDHHAHHTECSTYQHANMVNKRMKNNTLDDMFVCLEFNAKFKAHWPICNQRVCHHSNAVAGKHDRGAFNPDANC